MKKKLLILSTIISLLFYACDEKKQTSTTDSTQTETPTSLNEGDPIAVLTSLRDSTDKAWQIMITSDDQKISDITRLLEEISYCNKYNALLLDSLMDAVKTMKSTRYQQLTMTSEQIDQYDMFTDKIISRVKYLARTTEELKSHPIGETLYNDIAQADNDVARYRANYDGFALNYNNYLETNKQTLGEKASSFPKLPVFSLSA